MMRLAFLILCFWVIPCIGWAKGNANIVIEAQSGTILEGENIHSQYYPASLTKLMTLYLTFEALNQGKLKLDQPLKVSRHASQQPSSKLWVKPGETITVKQAIQALIIRSANDIAVVLAEAIGGSEPKFAQIMTQRAVQLGMYKTRFTNPHGLYDPRQVTTPRDMALLVRSIMLQFPQYYGFFGETSFKFKGNKIYTHNRFVKNYAGADGLKTGYIDASGFNLAASAVRNNTRLIGVVFGGDTAQKRDKKMASLMDKGFTGARQMLAQKDERPLPTRKVAQLRPKTKQSLALAAPGAQKVPTPPAKPTFLGRGLLTAQGGE